MNRVTFRNDLNCPTSKGCWLTACLSGTLVMTLLGLAAPATAQQTWRLKLEEVRIVQQRERDGDRPYFVIIQPPSQGIRIPPIRK